MSAVNPVTASLLSRLHTQQPITSSESHALAMLLGRVDHARRYVETRGTEHPIATVLLREILDDFLGEPLLSGTAPSSTADTPPQPRVWRDGDTIPADIQVVYSKRDMHFRHPAPQGRGPDDWWNPSTAVISEQRLLSEHGPVSDVPAVSGGPA